MFDLAPSPADNQEVYNCYVQTVKKLQQGAEELKRLEELLKDKYMAVTKTDRTLIEESVTSICSAAWGLKIQGAKIKQARAKSRIMTACEIPVTDKEVL